MQEHGGILLQFKKLELKCLLDNQVMLVLSFLIVSPLKLKPLMILNVLSTIK